MVVATMSKTGNLRRRGRCYSDSGVGGQLNPEGQAANDELQEIEALQKSIRECENRIEEHHEILEMANNELEDLALLREQMLGYQNRVEEQASVLNDHEAELVVLRDQNQILEVLLNELIDATPEIEEQFEQMMWILSRKIYAGVLWGLKVIATFFFCHWIGNSQLPLL
ncbi:hypothetical protein EYC80_004926 [Monilinia laxa]|uniref:Uncharacterized protein n=1 Tax=Monilinia laxa TaxID=61186 RepID=A0A5N6KIJ8_MONLA|nr:hypothetical protein EYC80_004926 [Monilinia laxa]